MLRVLGLAGVAAVHLASASAAVAQAAPDAAGADEAVQGCPRGAVSVYFPIGQATPSPETQALIVRIGEAAATCAPTRIDIVAHIDLSVDGETAVTATLQRLHKIAADLIARGLPAEKIRIAAQAVPAERAATSGFTQVEVRFRDGSEPPVETAPARVRAVQSSSI